jgi:hypothetical protein
VPNPVNPQSWNRFSYVNNSPINYNDPTGHYVADTFDGECKPEQPWDICDSSNGGDNENENDNEGDDGGKETNPFGNCNSSPEDLNVCYEKVTLDLYEDAGIDLWYTALYPPFHNPLAEYYDLSPLLPQMLINSHDPVNVRFLQQLYVDSSYIYNYESVYLKHLKAQNHIIYERVKEQVENEGVVTQDDILQKIFKKWKPYGIGPK